MSQELILGRKYLTDAGAIVKPLAVMETRPDCYAVEVINHNNKPTWQRYAVDYVLIDLTKTWRVLPE